MKLLELKVNGLFGTFDHHIKFNDEESITILTAPNGYGKTIVLKIIDAIFGLKISFLRKLDFKYIELVTDINTLNIIRTKKNDSYHLDFWIEVGDIFRVNKACNAPSIVDSQIEQLCC